MLKTIFKVISLLFHPLLMLTLILLTQMWMQPNLFLGSNPQFKGILIISVFSTTFLMPGVATLLMKFMNLLPSLEMPEKSHRTGPLIVTAIFHLWIYKNLLDNPEVPLVFGAAALGAILTLFICFFINLFHKISLHAAGLGGWLSAVFICVLYYAQDQFLIVDGEEVQWSIHAGVFISFLIFITGMVTAGRLYLKAHTPQELIGGFFVGVSGQLLAFMYMI